LVVTASARVKGYKTAGRKVAVLVNGKRQMAGLTDGKGRLVLRVGRDHIEGLRPGRNTLSVVVYPGSSRYRPAFGQTLTVTLQGGRVQKVEAQK
jgi:hypothetical protein